MNLIFKFFPWLIVQIFIAGWTLASDVVTGSKKVDPCVVHYPLRVEKRWQLAMLSTCVTVTPGTLSIGLREEGILIVHAVHGSDPQGILADIADMEARMAPEVAQQEQDLTAAEVEYPAPRLVAKED